MTYIVAPPYNLWWADTARPSADEDQTIPDDVELKRPLIGMTDAILELALRHGRPCPQGIALDSAYGLLAHRVNQHADFARDPHGDSSTDDPEYDMLQQMRAAQSIEEAMQQYAAATNTSVLPELLSHWDEALASEQES